MLSDSLGLPLCAELGGRSYRAAHPVRLLLTQYDFLGHYCKSAWEENPAEVTGKY